MAAPANPMSDALATLASIQDVGKEHLSVCPLCHSPVYSERISCERGMQIAADLRYADQTIYALSQRAILRLVR